MAIEKALRWIVLGGIFILPFIVFIAPYQNAPNFPLNSGNLFFPFITGKNFTFRIIVEIITGAWLALALVNSVYRPRRSWLLGAFALFVVVVALADAFGAYPFKSFWSNFERMDGWVTLAHLFCYFVVASSSLTSEKLWRAFWHTVLAVSIIVGLYGLLQLIGVVSLNPGFSSIYRIDATLGNPIYLAGFMLFSIGIAAVLWARAAEDFPQRTLEHRLLYGSIIAFDTLILLLTGTRGAMIGLIGGIVLSILILALSQSVTQRIQRLSAGALAGIFILAGGFWLIREEGWVQKVPFLQRLATISLTDSTTQARFYNWGMAWQGVKERPILGWGQENYAIVFDKYYDPRMYAQEQWFDRVHNVVFDWLVAAGFLGLFSYLSLFVFAIWTLWRTTEARIFSSLESSILTGLLAAYFSQNLFVFDNITSYILFASVLAYIAWRGSERAATLPMPTFPRGALPFVAVGVALLVWGIAWFTNANALAANRALIQALGQHKEGIQKNLEYVMKAISYGSLGTQEAREQLVQLTSQVIRSENVPIEMKQDFLNAAVREMSLMIEASPLDARAPLFLGALLSASGNYADAKRAFQKAHELSPGKQTILFELASVTALEGDVEGALAIYKQAFELEPTNADARLFYAAAAIRASEDALADELLKPLIETGNAADVRIAAGYVSRGRYDKIVEIWEAHIKSTPNDAQAYFTLAAAYYGAGDPARAISTLEKVAAIAPGAKAQADALISEIKSGTAKIR